MTTAESVPPQVAGTALTVLHMIAGEVVGVTSYVTGDATDRLMAVRS